MIPGEPQVFEATSARIRRLEEYKDTVARLFPALPRRVVDEQSISGADALVIGCLLDCFPREVSTLDAGMSTGSSTFCFAAHPKVREVVSVYPNSGTVGETSGLPRGLRALEVTRSALAEFAEENEKVRLHEGAVGDAVTDAKKAGTTEAEPSDGVSLVAFMDWLRTREGVRQSLEAVFAGSPKAVAILDGCRHARGPFVQAGVVSFMEAAQQKYRFRLLADLGPSLASANLGLVYPETEAAEIEKVLTALGDMFSQRLDPLLLLSREEVLVGTINRLGWESEQPISQPDQVARLEKKISRLKARHTRLRENDARMKKHNSHLRQQNSRLTARYSKRRYRLVDTLAEGALRIPLVKSLLRRGSQPDSEKS